MFLVLLALFISTSGYNPLTLKLTRQQLLDHLLKSVFAANSKQMIKSVEYVSKLPHITIIPNSGFKKLEQDQLEVYNCK